MFRYPVEVVSDMYLSRIGGYSYELDRREVGINAKALEMNTSIIPNETIATIRTLDDRKPYFFKKKFVVVAVEENMECYEFTANGEVVLPEEVRDRMRAKVGDEVIVNTTESFRIDGDYTNVARAMLWRLESRLRRN
ncbi:AbrB/MazE/SpoVT family DNA-binding domain-containing protein [Archaeoglobus neptunius]|uniref:AbrB/MazE/SpoVT family DNA-binding domain-containing protein n=1 Tax=Archaeoglobus neptunius TaxID=2798580 RepID=UPI0019282C66|nr:AbrB/MazE/SpoVT family DNA-binding domain-containing protein [Archaeoglobus neptunius]